MSENRVAKIVPRQKAKDRRPKVGPRVRRLDDEEADLQQIRVLEWRPKAQDRSEWRDMLEQARPLHGL